MKKLLLLILIILVAALYGFENKDQTIQINSNNSFIMQQSALEGNNIRSWIWNTGAFDQDLRTTDTPGFEWPIETTHRAMFTAGLTIAGYVNNQLRMAAASYKGEYRPGYCINGQFFTDTTFHHYVVKTGDSYLTNPDWRNWGQMVPYGAPYIDVNHNGTFDYSIDTPGVRNSSETIFICITDADPTTHSTSEGFGGGTAPLFAEAHLTAWCYDNPGYQDMQFLKWDIINKGIALWDTTCYAVVSDPDLGDPYDDYLGCDTSRNLVYCYNSDNMDGNGTARTYGLNPPSIGICLLNCNVPDIKLNSFTQFAGTGAGGPVCEQDPGTSVQSYCYMFGLKKDRTPFVVPNTNPPLITKFIDSGDPETGSGWTEFVGRVPNCGGSLTGNLQSPSDPGDRRCVMGMKNNNRIMNPGDTQVIQIAQLIARGSNNLNSVTQLKHLTDIAQQLCQNGFVIGIKPISTEIPTKFNLYQNYPNPFNPNTVIKFQIAKLSDSKLIVYNALGQEITTLVNEELKPGTYSIEWNAADFPSGVYFYKLETENYSETKKMVLLK